VKVGADRPLGGSAVNETVPLNRLSESSFICVVSVCPAEMDKDDGKALMLKSGWITCTPMLTECDSAYSVFWPVTTMLYLPAEVDAGTIMLICVVAPLLYLIASEEAAMFASTPVSAEADKFTVPLNL